MYVGHSHHLGMLDFGEPGDITRLHMLVRRNDLPVFDLLGEGAYLNQDPGWGSRGMAGLVNPRE